MHITMISAMDRNRIIGGADGGIPWHLPRDVERFRSFTRGKHLLLGRRTYEEMTGWFTDQTPIVLTRNADFDCKHGRIAHDVEQAIAHAAEDGATELAVCGGSSVYEAALPYTDELFLTLIDAAVEGASSFPDYKRDIEWEEVSREEFPPDDDNEYGMNFVQLRRLHPSSLRPARLHLL